MIDSEHLQQLASKRFVLVHELHEIKGGGGGVSRLHHQSKSLIKQHVFSLLRMRSSAINPCRAVLNCWGSLRLAPQIHDGLQLFAVTIVASAISAMGLITLKYYTKMSMCSMASVLRSHWVASRQNTE